MPNPGHCTFQTHVEEKKEVRVIIAVNNIAVFVKTVASGDSFLIFCSVLRESEGEVVDIYQSVHLDSRNYPELHILIGEHEGRRHRENAEWGNQLSDA